MAGRGNPGPDYVPDTRPCEQVEFEVWLVDVDTTVSAQLSVGDRLPVRLIEERYPAVFLDEARVGSIASGVLSRLVECLRGRASFGAEVLEINGNLVRVRVSWG